MLSAQRQTIFQCLIDSNIRIILTVSIALLLTGCPTEDTVGNAPTDPEDYLYSLIYSPPADDPDVNPSGSIYHVAPWGNDAQDGSIDLPFKSVEMALTVIAPGDIIYLRGGTHELSSSGKVGLKIQGVDGEPGKPIKLWNYRGEHPVFVPADPRVTNVGIRFSSSYWHIRGLEVTGVKQQHNDDGSATHVIGFQVTGSSGSVFEAVESHHNEGTGFYLGGNSTDNLVLNSDFHHNGDPYTAGNAYGNADGMHIRVEHPGTINKVKGVRSWNNSDDGYDTWFTSGAVIFEDSWAFWNGYEEGMTVDLGGDGNGFKLGPYNDRGIAPDLATPLRIVIRCMAFQNLARGFTWNDGSMLMHLYNNSSFANWRGYVFNDPVKVLTNNLSLNDGGNGINPEAEQSRNSWNPGFLVSQGDFISVDSVGMDSARGPDGSLPVTDFLKLAPGSTLIDAGVYTGHPYNGSAPDIGSRESDT